MIADGADVTFLDEDAYQTMQPIAAMPVMAAAMTNPEVLDPSARGGGDTSVDVGERGA